MRQKPCTVDLGDLERQWREKANSEMVEMLTAHAKYDEFEALPLIVLASLTARNDLANTTRRPNPYALLGHTVAVHLATYITPTERGARAAASGLGAAISGLW
jgi:hypothetical protein